MDLNDRQDIEHRIVLQIVVDAIAAGYSLSVNDGEETRLRCSRNADAILDAMMTSARDHLLVHKPDQRRPFGWIMLSYGNEGWNVISDYTIHLEELLAGAIAVAAEHGS